MKVVITGASGFIGRALAQRFRERGDQVVGIDTAPSPGVRLGSTLEPESWAGELAGADLLIHTAAVVSTVAPLREAWRVNVLGTARVLQACVAAQVRHFVFLSSVAVWGDDFPDGVTEADPPVVQRRSYADTKINGEAVVLAETGIDVTVIRPGDVYGPGSRPWVVLPVEVIRRGQLILPDWGRGIFSPTYIDNLVDGVELAIGHRGVFTITDGVGVPTKEYFGRLADMVGGRIWLGPTGPVVRAISAVGAIERALGRTSELSANSAGMMLRRGTYSIAKAQQHLGYRPAIDLDEGMVRTRAWLADTGLL